MRRTAAAYTSTIIIFIFLVGVIIYHVYLLVRKDCPRGKKIEMSSYPLAPVQPAAKAEVTHSVIEIPNPRDQSPPPEDTDCEQIEVKEIVCTATPAYQQLTLFIRQQLFYSKLNLVSNAWLCYFFTCTNLDIF